MANEYSLLGSTRLRLSNISKSFGTVSALRQVDLDVRAGEVHALVGENGAGKSTLIKIVAGAEAPDTGSIELDGIPLGALTPSQARRLGIAVIYQQPALFPDMSVAENIALRTQSGSAWTRIRWRERQRVARALLDRVGASIDPDVEVRSLTMPQQQLVEIAAALGGDARLIILDEPTASLGEKDAQNLFRIIDELRAAGTSVIYISHRLEEVMRLADRVTVLRDGTRVATRDAYGITSAEMIRLMVGRPLSAVFHKEPADIGEIVLQVQHLSCAAGKVRHIDLIVHAGEIVGLAGLMGAGRTELARILFGLTPADTGMIKLNGRPQNIRTPAEAVSAGMAYLPEDRRRHGVILDMPVNTNTTLAILKDISRGTWIDFAKEDQIAEDFVLALGTKTPSIQTLVGHLSGGNQQKVALARWLATKPKVIILDEPTQGVDVGAKAEIHKLIGDLVRQGLAVILISSELPELLGVADRIAVMRGGTIVATLTRAEATQERVMKLALTGEPDEWLAGATQA